MSDSQPGRKAGYEIRDAENIPTPCLMFFEEKIRANTSRAIAIAGNAGRLRPHIKTHKTVEICKIQIGMGIGKFKCATIAEAEVLGMAGAAEVLLAYPLVGPNIGRFIELARVYPDTRFSTVFDDTLAAQTLSDAAFGAGIKVGMFVDIDAGLHRTGVDPAAATDMYRFVAGLPGLDIRGIHCYDGHIHQADLAERRRDAENCLREVAILKARLESAGLSVPTVVLGGTPAFGIYADLCDYDLSPGTCFLQDWGYGTAYPDLDFEPAALVLSRVVSRNEQRSTFTLDLGCKGLASDPPGKRGVIFDREPGYAEPVFQNEEHWVFGTGNKELPKPGTLFLVQPTHICPTVALYAQALVVNTKGYVQGAWKIAARDRAISI